MSTGDVVDEVLAAIAAGDAERLKPLLHPYLHWSDAAVAGLRGRRRVMEHLSRHPVRDPPARVELRDGQIYRWQA